MFDRVLSTDRAHCIREFLLKIILRVEALWYGFGVFLECFLAVFALFVVLRSLFDRVLSVLFDAVVINRAKSYTPNAS